MGKRSREHADVKNEEHQTADELSAVRKSRKREKASRKEREHTEASHSSVDEHKAAKKTRKEKKLLKKLQRETTKADSTTGNAGFSTQEIQSNRNADLESAKKVEKHKSLKSINNNNNNNNEDKIDGDKERNREKRIQSSEAPVSKDNILDKNYSQSAELTALSSSTIDKFLSENLISITDPISTTTPLRPIIEFSYLPFTDLEKLSYFKNFKAPTPIQAAAWPFLFSGRDVIGVAETGSGKTMAFSLPCIRRILTLQSKKRSKGARAVVVSPTRELAMQSYEQIIQLCGASDIKVVCVYGGVSKDEQRKALRMADIIVATPGRLNDFIIEGCADLSRADYVVLDEADRMLDKGFEEEIKKIISKAPEVGTRQTLMFTATWPESVRNLASTFMKSPVKILIGDKTGDLRANNRIEQKVEVIDPRNKEFRLLQTLKEHQSGSQKNDRIIVFALYKKEATRIEGFIRSKGFRVAGIHGDLSQDQRTRSLESFKQGNTPILVATDVAARGLDIPSVKLVLNLTFPLTVEDYVHRIGRTGRAGNEGLAITFFTEHDKAQSGALINVLKAAKQNVPEALLKFGTTVKKKEHEAYGAFVKDVDMTKKAQKIKFD